MNLFRSEEHLKRWLLFFHAAGDYVMSVSDWATVFSVSMFRRRLEPDYLTRSAGYLEDYRQALRAMGKTLPAPDRVLSTVMFTDIVDSTEQAALVGDAEWRSRLEHHNQVVRSQLEHFGGREIKQTGDGFLSAFDSPARAIRCAIMICQAMTRLGLQVRTGIHSGECEVLGDDLGGIAVHIGARIGAIAGPNEVLVSQTVKEAVTGSDIDFEHRGAHDLKGVPGQWELYAAVP
jgi:class 3 adenylate cyclase